VVVRCTKKMLDLLGGSNLEWHIAHDGGLDRADINELNDALRRMLRNRGDSDYARPIELVTNASQHPNHRARISEPYGHTLTRPRGGKERSPADGTSRASSVRRPSRPTGSSNEPDRVVPVPGIDVHLPHAERPAAAGGGDPAPVERRPG
jgi:hypothetical protein